LVPTARARSRSSTTGAPSGFTYELSGSSLLIKQAGTLVLSVTLNTTTGAYTITQNNPIDHATGDNENNQGFTIGYRVTDGDGDTVDGSLNISVDDDTPTANPQARPISATVHEDGLAIAQGDLSDGNREGGETTSDDEASGAAGALTGLFLSGADKPLEISFSHDTSGLPTLFSKGDAVTYSVSGNVLTATADAGGPDQRVVFTLTVNADGSWSFDLKDQLDHVDNGLNDENFAIRTQAGGATSVNAIDFSSIIIGTDHDGDSVAAASGTFTVAVQDDVPAGDISGTVSVHVDEDELSTASGDGSTGITDGDADTKQATFTGAALSAVIAGGADEPVDLKLNEAISGNVLTTGGDPVLSQGANVIWGTANGALVGFVNVGGGAGYDAGTDRLVFRLTDNGDGSFTFDLKDQIDHAPASDDDAILTLDLTKGFLAADFDGDEITLPDGTIRVDVENDIPQAASGAVASIHVDEDDLTTASGDGSTGITDGDADLDHATFTSASLAGLVTDGADEPVDFKLNTSISGNVETTGGAAVLSQGANVIWGTDGGALVGFVNVGGGAGYDAGTDRLVFRLSDNGDGTFTFDLKDQIDHAAASGDEATLILNLTGAFTATDFDGDAVTLNANSIRVEVENDVPAGVVSGSVHNPCRRRRSHDRFGRRLDRHHRWRCGSRPCQFLDRLVWCADHAGCGRKREVRAESRRIGQCRDDGRRGRAVARRERHLGNRWQCSRRLRECRWRSRLRCRHRSSGVPRGRQRRRHLHLRSEGPGRSHDGGWR
jgi:T1SS-143 domain-containing protein